MATTSGWKNPRWAEIQDPVYRHIFQSLEEWTRNPTVQTISTPHSTVQPTYNAVTDRVDQPSPVTLFGDQLVAGKIQSSNYVAGSAGWVIKADGTAEFSSVTVRGDLKAGTVPSGFLSGLARFEAISTGTTIREGSLSIDATNNVNGINFRLATSGPAYTTVGGISGNTSGTGRLQIEGGVGSAEVSVHLGNGSVKSFAGNLNLEVGGNGLVISDNASGTDLGIVAGFLGDTNGRCWIQAKSETVTTDASGVGTVTFPTAFPGTPVVVACDGNIGIAVEYIVQVLSKSTTGFTFQVRDHTGGTRVSGTFKVEWIATYAA